MTVQRTYPMKLAGRCVGRVSPKDGHKRKLQLRLAGIQARLERLDGKLQEESVTLRTAIEAMSPTLLQYRQEKSALIAIAIECEEGLARIPP